MSQTLSSAYTGLAQLLTSAGHTITPAELQGALWGRTVAGANTQAEQTLKEMTAFLTEGELIVAITQAVMGLQAMIIKELMDDSLAAVTLLLPDDDEPLAHRLNALSDWGQGFLAGFGLVKQENKLSIETLEILQDISAITQLELDVEKEDEPRSENDYMELVEFLRIAPLLIANELKITPSSTSELIH